MKNKRNQGAAIFAAAALMLTMSAGVGRAMAYFTTYVLAEGGQELHLGFTTTVPSEKVENWTKNITVQNTGDNPCYVRVKVFAGDAYGLSFTDQSGGGWTRGADDYYYWHNVLAPKDTEGSTTGSLLVGIDKKDAQQSFQVIVVQECTPVPWDEEGNVIPWDQVDWDRKAELVVKTERESTIAGGEDAV